MSTSTCTLWEEELDETLHLKTGEHYVIVVRERTGQIFARLFDETGTFILRHTEYEAHGFPKGEICGTTDSEGVLHYTPLPIGDYRVTVGGRCETVIPTLLPHACVPHDQIVVGLRIEESQGQLPTEEVDVFEFPSDSTVRAEGKMPNVARVNLE